MTGSTSSTMAHYLEPKKVSCYDLWALLSKLVTKRDLRIVRPFLRPTFTETWAATIAETPLFADGNGRTARLILRRAARDGYGDPSRVFGAGEGVERALYELAERRREPVIMGPART